STNAVSAMALMANSVSHGCGTSKLSGGTYACRSVMQPTMAAKTMLCQMTALKMSASLPSWFVAAVATQMLWASIILPMTPPVLLVVQIRTCNWPCVCNPANTDELEM